MNEQPSARLFIAVELPAPVKTELEKLQLRLGKQPGDGIKWVAPESAHLTLKFLGNTAWETVGDIKAALSKTLECFAPFQLQLSGLGAFPGTHRPAVLWCGLSGDTDHLFRLQRTVEAAVSPLGFPTEKRPFSPHLTLARLRDGASSPLRRALSERLSAQGDYSGPWFEATEVSLVQSALTPSGPVYSRLAVYCLTCQ